MMPWTSRRVARGDTASGVSYRGSAAWMCLTIRATVSSSMSCGRTPSPPNRAMVSAIRLPVTAFMFAERSDASRREIGWREVRLEARAALEVAGFRNTSSVESSSCSSWSGWRNRKATTLAEFGASCTDLRGRSRTDAQRRGAAHALVGVVSGNPDKQRHALG